MQRDRQSPKPSGFAVAQGAWNLRGRVHGWRCSRPAIAIARRRNECPVCGLAQDWPSAPRGRVSVVISTATTAATSVPRPNLNADHAIDISPIGIPAMS